MMHHEMILGKPAMTAFNFKVDAKNRRIETSNTDVADKQEETPEVHQRFPMRQEITKLLQQHKNIFKRTTETADLPPVSLGMLGVLLVSNCIIRQSTLLEAVLEADV